MLALSAIYGWDIQQMDIKGAYLNGDLEEEIYMIQPPEYDDNTGKVLLLIHSLYGLKQSGRAWYHKLKQVLLKHGFEQVTVEHCLYIRNRNGMLEVISAWVDDLLLFGPDPGSTLEIKTILGREFEVHNLGEPHYLIGMEINRDHCVGTITLSQKQYIRKVLEKHQMSDLKSVTTPIDPNVVLLKWTKPPDDGKASHLYATAIGSLMYAAIGSRPNIAFAVQTLSQFTQKPGPEH